ncbi:hypothetical protein AAVH_25008 [Aphelenchoides avenae]|nr:hypothetical protein AAVH_25008 [Aphelenchus avenae]
MDAHEAAFASTMIQRAAAILQQCSELMTDVVSFFNVRRQRAEEPSSTIAPHAVHNHAEYHDDCFSRTGVSAVDYTSTLHWQATLRRHHKGQAVIVYTDRGSIIISRGSESRESRRSRGTFTVYAATGSSAFAEAAASDYRTDLGRSFNRRQDHVEKRARRSCTLAEATGKSEETRLDRIDEQVCLCTYRCDRRPFIGSRGLVNSARPTWSNKTPNRYVYS